MTEPPRPSESQPAPQTSQAGRTGPEKRAALPRELSDFLIEFSIALHKHAMYPGGHPTLAPAAEGVARRLEGLLAERGKLSLGVARDQLIIEGVATDPKNPVLHDLADRLHRHQLGAVSFNRGVSSVELEEALKLVASDADRNEDPIGLRPADKIPRWPHLELYPLTFDRLELVGGPEDAEGTSKDVTGGRGALLWVGLARAALAGDDRQAAAAPRAPEPNAFRLDAPTPTGDAAADAAKGQAGGPDVTNAEPAAVAKAIAAHERGTAYDQVIVGYMLQIADDLKAGGSGQVALKKKMSRLITSLDEDTMARLIEMGGDLKQRRAFLNDASQGVSAEAVVDLAKAAQGTGAPISNSMMRMLGKLSQHAERGAPQRRTMADADLREQMAQLLKGWELSDPNPDGYSHALQKMSEAAPTMIVASEVAYAAEPERMVKMAIEAGGTGEPLDRAVSDFVLKGRIPDLVAILDSAPRDNPATQRVRDRVQDPDMLGAALRSQPVDFALVDQLIQAMGARAAKPMLDVLTESESRTLRRALIDRLLKHPDHTRPLLAERVNDQRWYVTRNMLFLAAELPGALALDAKPFSQHEDSRVRREALRVLFRDGVERTRAICTALADDDPRVKRLALNAVVEGGVPEPAVPLIVSLAYDDENDTELRVAAVRALAAKGGRNALEALLKLTEIKRRSIIDIMAQSQATPEYLAAVTALGSFRAEPRAKERLELIARGRDPGAARAATDALKGGA